MENTQKEHINYRCPEAGDGLKVTELIKSCPPLDINSTYYYYMICRDFASTSILAEKDGKIGGFVSGYRRPDHPEVLFIWQVAVSSEMRGKSIASSMLASLVERLGGSVKSLETTISPSNKASQSLFAKFAEKRGAEMKKQEFLSAQDFGGGDHEAEDLYIIDLS